MFEGLAAKDMQISQRTIRDLADDVNVLAIRDLLHLSVPDKRNITV